MELITKKQARHKLRMQNIKVFADDSKDRLEYLMNNEYKQPPYKTKSIFKITDDHILVGYPVTKENVISTTNSLALKFAPYQHDKAKQLDLILIMIEKCVDLKVSQNHTGNWGVISNYSQGNCRFEFQHADKKEVLLYILKNKL